MAKTVFGMPGVGNKPSEGGKPNAGAPAGKGDAGAQGQGNKPAMAKPATGRPAMARPVNAPMAKPLSPSPNTGGAGPAAGGIKTVFGMPAVKAPSGSGSTPPAKAPTPSRDGIPYQATEAALPQLKSSQARGASSPAPPPDNAKFAFNETVIGVAAMGQSDAPPPAAQPQPTSSAPEAPQDSPMTGLDDLLADPPSEEAEIDAGVADAIPSEPPETAYPSDASHKAARGGSGLVLKLVIVLVAVAVVAVIAIFFIASRGSVTPVRPPALPPTYTPNPAAQPTGVAGVPQAPGAPTAPGAIPPPPPPPPGAVNVMPPPAPGQ